MTLALLIGCGKSDAGISGTGSATTTAAETSTQSSSSVGTGTTTGMTVDDCPMLTSMDACHSIGNDYFGCTWQTAVPVERNGDTCTFGEPVGTCVGEPVVMDGCGFNGPICDGDVVGFLVGELPDGRSALIQGEFCGGFPPFSYCVPNDPEPTPSPCVCGCDPGFPDP